MEVKNMLFFKRVAELEHMTKASQELRVSQPFLSHCIAELEEELDVKLFDRVGRSIVLNDYGRAFYLQVVKMFHIFADAQQELKDMKERRNNAISIVTNVGLYMPRLFGEVARVEPRLSIRLHSARRKRILSMLKEGLVDFAICCPPIDESGYETFLLMEESATVIYPEGHWLKDYSAVRIRDLEREAFISVAPGYGTRDATELFFLQAGIKPNIVVESTDTASILGFVKNGIGIAIAASSIIAHDLFFATHHVPITEPELKSEVGLTRLPDRYQNHSCQVFSNVAKAHFRNLEQELLHGPDITAGKMPAGRGC